MADIEYCMWFDGVPATQAQLDRVEEIEVQQEVDLAWEARVQIPVCVNDDGKWAGAEEAWMRNYARVRIEV
ncbi:MAG TPA: hypothetical protein VE775_00765, partial [Pyrinomonadaceae bacterium]|nr:hypothetical protein [Pyrinomonadaceae bacterium]